MEAGQYRLSLSIEAHAAWLEAQGYAPNTISHMLGHISAFYRWCGDCQIDAECGPNYNPAAGVKRPKYQLYPGADGKPVRLFNREEVDALLEEMAGTRCVLRNTLALASQAFDAQNLRAALRFVEVYGMGCARLVRLLRATIVEGGRLHAYVMQAFLDVCALVTRDYTQGEEEWPLFREELKIK